MVDIIGLLIIVGICAAAFQEVGIKGVIVGLIGGGLGFAIGSIANIGWSIFGAVLGGLIGGYYVYEQKNS